MTSKYRIFPESIKKILRKTFFYKKRAIRKKNIIPYYEVGNVLKEAPPLHFDKEITNKPKVAIIKDDGLHIIKDYVNPKDSWLRYERFCKNNNISYEFYDITKSNWIKEAERFDIFICHTASNPAFQEMIESKIYILENIMHKFCFPSYHEVWQYENKNRANYLYQCYNLPNIPTHVTNNKAEALEIINKISYPFITKTTIGAGSTGVKKIKSKLEAKVKINRIFGIKGLKTQYPYQRQKDYMYIQEFIDDARFDLRIMLVGDMAFGYYRYPNSGDYRASGSGIVDKKAIPTEALKLAIDIRSKLKSRLMGVDLLYSKKHHKYFIIETSLFNQIDTAEQLVIDGNPGYYDITDVNNITFKKGKFWIHELVIKYVVEEWFNKQHH
jgi:glutathione synthase/RimK-type ligase-like ATP-grasp enzyme